MGANKAGSLRNSRATPSLDLSGLQCTAAEDRAPIGSESAAHQESHLKPISGPARVLGRRVCAGSFKPSTAGIPHDEADQETTDALPAPVNLLSAGAEDLAEGFDPEGFIRTHESLRALKGYGELIFEFLTTSFTDVVSEIATDEDIFRDRLATVERQLSTLGEQNLRSPGTEGGKPNTAEHPQAGMSPYRGRTDPTGPRLGTNPSAKARPARAKQL